MFCCCKMYFHFDLSINLWNIHNSHVSLNELIGAKHWFDKFNVNYGDFTMGCISRFTSTCNILNNNNIIHIILLFDSIYLKYIINVKCKIQYMFFNLKCNTQMDDKKKEITNANLISNNFLCRFFLFPHFWVTGINLDWN